MTRSIYFLLLAICWLGLVPESWAVRIEDLEAGRIWRLRAVAIAGNEKLASSELEKALLTQTRPWYRFWSERPVFDPVTFREDLERLRRLYEAHGLYHAEIDYDLALDRDSGLGTAQITVAEGAPVIVADIDVSVAGNPSFPQKLPIATGAIFSEDSYQR